MEFLKATPAYDDILVKHYLAIWDSYGTPAHHFDVEPAEKVARFIEEGRALRQLATFLAFDGGFVPIAPVALSCRAKARISQTRLHLERLRRSPVTGAKAYRDI